jgi:hypothetical protein
MQHHPVQEIVKPVVESNVKIFQRHLCFHITKITPFSVKYWNTRAQNENRNLLLHSSPPSQLLIPAGIPIFRIERCLAWIKNPAAAPKEKGFHTWIKAPSATPKEEDTSNQLYFQLFIKHLSRIIRYLPLWKKNSNIVLQQIFNCTFGHKINVTLIAEGLQLHLRGNHDPNLGTNFIEVCRRLNVDAL